MLLYLNVPLRLVQIDFKNHKDFIFYFIKDDNN